MVHGFCQAREIAGQTTPATVLCDMGFGGSAHVSVPGKNDHIGADSRHG